MFSKTAQYYDIIYSFKNYEEESKTIFSIIRSEKRSGGTRLLDVACGTGLHLLHLGERFQVEGLDLDRDLLAIAQQRNPGVELHHGDMTDFELGRTFDVITCLFSSIGYVKTLEKLDAALACMARHLTPGGIVIVEPWFTPDRWTPGTVHAKFIDEPELKIARINTSHMDGRISYFDMNYLIGTPQETVHVVERHELGLFTVEEMLASFAKAGFETRYDPKGLMDRGLYIGRL